MAQLSGKAFAQVVRMTCEKEVTVMLCAQHNACKARNGRAGYVAMMRALPLPMRLARVMYLALAMLANGKTPRPCARS